MFWLAWVVIEKNTYTASILFPCSLFFFFFFSASILFPCSRWYNGWFSYTPRSTLLVQIAQGLALKGENLLSCFTWACLCMSIIMAKLLFQIIPKIGMIAVNDGIILRTHISRILKKHFKGKPYYVDLLDLFNEVRFYPCIQWISWIQKMVLFLL